MSGLVIRWTLSIQQSVYPDKRNEALNAQNILRGGFRVDYFERIMGLSIFAQWQATPHPHPDQALAASRQAMQAASL